MVHKIKKKLTSIYHLTVVYKVFVCFILSEPFGCKAGTVCNVNSVNVYIYLCVSKLKNSKYNLF